MNKNKNPYKHDENILHDHVLQIGAWLVTGATILSTTEALRHQPAIAQAVPVTVPIHANTELPRAEGAAETVRSHEDYDVGLRTPTISTL